MAELEEVAHDLMEHSWSVANCPWLDHDDHSEHNHRRDEDGHECPTVVTQGERILCSSPPPPPPPPLPPSPSSMRVTSVLNKSLFPPSQPA